MPGAERRWGAGGAVVLHPLLVLQAGVRVGMLATTRPVAVPEVQGTYHLGRQSFVGELFRVWASCSNCRHFRPLTSSG